MSFVKNALSTVCAFAFAIWLLKVTMPRPLPEETVEAETELGHASECSVLFVGPSYVKSQIHPELFDAEAKRIGLEARACKYGLTSLRSYELKWEIDRLLSSRDWPKLELVVIDITLGKRLDFPEQNWFKRRVIDWHTLEAVPWLADYYGGRRGSWLKNAPAFFTHAKHVAANYLELGRGAELVARLSEPGDGVRNRRVADTHEQYVEKLRDLKRAHRAKKRKYASSDWPLELRELVRSHDLEAYFLYAPVWRTYRLPDRSAKGRDRLVVLDFADPYGYPDLYKEEARGRTSHLSGEAAYHAYARALAEELKKRWRPGR